MRKIKVSTNAGNEMMQMRISLIGTKGAEYGERLLRRPFSFFVLNIFHQSYNCSFAGSERESVIPLCAPNISVINPTTIQ